MKHIYKLLSAGAAFLSPTLLHAKSGSVDYSWGADALARAHDFAVTSMLYLNYIIYAVGAVLSIIAALQIFIKMNNQENDIKKQLMMLIGAILFMIGATIVFPAFFGYQI